MDAKILVLVICVEAIRYLLLHNLPNCTFVTSNMNTVLNMKRSMQNWNKSISSFIYTFASKDPSESNHRATINCFVFVNFS